MSDSTAKKAEQNHAVRKSGARHVTEKEWEQIVVLALRGNTPAAIARMTGWSRRTIWRWWTHGVPWATWAQTPIRRVIEEEQAKARSLRQRIETMNTPTPTEVEERARVEAMVGGASLAEKEAAKKDALEARTAEGQLVKLSRGNVIALAGAAVGLVKPAAQIASQIGKVVSERIQDGKLPADEGIALLREIARYTKDVVDTGHRAMEMERLLLGDPSGGGRLASDAASMSLDEAMTELGNAAKVHAAMTKRGWSVVVGGGAPKYENPATTNKPNTFTPMTNEGQAFDASSSHVVSSTTDGGQSNDQAGDASAAGAAAAPEKDPNT